MSQLLSFYKLCPITDEIIGISEDPNKNSVICTLGKKIVYILQLNQQKQLKSWSTSDNFTSRVIYDFSRKQYVGVFSKTSLRFWDLDTEDINKVKKIKFNKQIHEIINVNVQQKKISLVVYADGSAESLDSALESRIEGKSKVHLDNSKSTIENVQFTNGIFSYVRQQGSHKKFFFTALDPNTLRSDETLMKSMKLDRSGQNVTLLASSVIRGKLPNSQSSLVTIWSDKRLFRTSLNPFEHREVDSSFYGTFHALVDAIKANSRLSMIPVSENCVAIYACKHEEDGSFVILYNIKFKIIQSRVPFKVFLANSKLWSLGRNIFLALGDQLSVIPYRISADQLSNMIGSQSENSDIPSVEKDTINEDCHFEDGLEFDENQEVIEDMEFDIDRTIKKRTILSKAKAVASADEVMETLNELYREDLIVDVIRAEDQPVGTVQAALMSNSGDETYPLLSENFELLCYELERKGCSEIEIGDKIFPILMKTNRTEEIGLLLKKLNHVSEKTLIKIMKYVLTCPEDSENEENVKNSEKMETDLKEIVVSKDRKFANANVLLSTEQSANRDILSIVLCNSFDAPLALKYLRSEITLNEMVLLMDHLYKILTTSSLDDPYEMRGNLVESDDFDLDTKLFEWFKLLLDSHYQPILLSHDSNLHKKLEMWLELVEDHIRILSEMSDMRELLVKLSTKRAVLQSKSCNQWYSIEKLELY